MNDDDDNNDNDHMDVSEWASKQMLLTQIITSSEQNKKKVADFSSTPLQCVFLMENMNKNSEKC